jgi:hypothetical protein
LGEIKRTLSVVVDNCYPDAVARTREAADMASDPVLAALEAAVAMAEHNPEGARAALWRLQADWETLQELEGRLLEARLGWEPVPAALHIGAAIQMARSELALPSPQLQRLIPQLMEWLESPRVERVGA